MDKSEPIYIAGHRGLVGSAIQRKLTAGGFKRLLTRTRAELDLTNRGSVERFFAAENRRRDSRHMFNIWVRFSVPRIK